MRLLKRLVEQLHAFANGGVEHTDAKVATFTRLLQSHQDEHTGYPYPVDKTLREIAADWGSYCSADFVIAILKALEKYDNGRALYCVEHLAQTKAITSDQWRVRTAAKTCLPVLQKRAEKLRLARTLVRSADGREAEAETLPRPASYTASDPKDLLRSSEAPDPPR